MMIFKLRSQFWRWTGGLGWSLDFILLCWALFLRKAGLIDQSEEALAGWFGGPPRWGWVRGCWDEDGWFWFC